MSSLPSVDILGTRLTAVTFDTAIARLIEAARSKIPTRAHFCTVHTVVEARRNPALRNAFSTAQMLAMDGVPLVWLARRRGHPKSERVCGPDAMLAVLDLGREHHLRHYFLGGRPGTAEALAVAMTQRFPGLAVVGTCSPPFGVMSAEQDQDLIEEVNAAAADIVWIGLGSPRQEIWAARRQGRLNAPVVLPVGAAFDFHSGRVRRAPGWMRRAGLEWLFRLAMDPRRLARRYVGTNSRFAYLIVKQWLGAKLRQTNVRQ